VIPSLATRGKLILATGISFVLIGAIHAAPPLIAMGALLLSSMLTAYLWFFPTAILLRRRKIELSWWVPPGDQPGGALAADRPFDMHIALRNHGMRGLRVLRLDIFASSGLDVPSHLEAVVPPGKQVELKAETVAHAAGYVVLHGAVIVFGDKLGLFDVRAYFPNPIALKVFPRQAALRGASGMMRPRGGALHERVGLHRIRRRGLSGELREIRDHSHGDPFKFIAWKATARRQKLMVRDLESEVVVTHQLLVDVAGSMRHGAAGRTKLHYAIETAAALARTTLDGGDRVGLITFDSRIYSQLKPSEGYHHYLKLVDRLIETRNIVDEDLTDLTNGELVAAVAKYLAHQEAVDVRLRRAPDLNDPAWERIHAGPSGELYDVGALSTVVSTLLKSYGATGQKSIAPAWWWSRVHIGAGSDPQMARLRLFCRLRGIELPFREHHERGVRAAGLAEAIAGTASGRSRADVVVILSDLSGVVDRPDIPLKQLGLARRSGQHVVFVAPFGPTFAPAPRTETGAQVHSVLTRAERARFEAGRRHLMRSGIPVVEVGPGDSIATLVRRLGRAQASMRRVA
jgi:uncharacterized protein (DUF58 family)